MKRLYMFLTIGLVFGLLTGCGSTKIDHVSTKTEVKVIKTPSYLLKNCSVTEPISKQDYLALGNKEKEKVLTEYSISLLKDLSKCNNQIRLISEFQDKEEKAILEIKDNK